MQEVAGSNPTITMPFCSEQFFWILVIDVLMLGYVGAMPAEGIYLVLARVGTVYYFLHCSIKSNR